MNFKHLILLAPILSGCAALTNPISYYQCSTSESEINSKINTMNKSYQKLVSTVDSNPTIQDKAQYTYYNKILVESVKIKVQNDKYYADSGDYYYCSESAKATISYIEGITTFLDNTTNTINTLSKNKNEIEAKLNCSSKEECDIEVSSELIKEINTQLIKLNIMN